MLGIYEAFEATDASLVEINRSSPRPTATLLALDAKMNFDDNALARTGPPRPARPRRGGFRSRSRPRGTR